MAQGCVCVCVPQMTQRTLFESVNRLGDQILAKSGSTVLLGIAGEGGEETIFHVSLWKSKRDSQDAKDSSRWWPLWQCFLLPMLQERHVIHAWTTPPCFPTFSPSFLGLSLTSPSCVPPLLLILYRRVPLMGLTLSGVLGRGRRQQKKCKEHALVWAQTS